VFNDFLLSFFIFDGAHQAVNKPKAPTTSLHTNLDSLLGNRFKSWSFSKFLGQISNHFYNLVVPREISIPPDSEGSIKWNDLSRESPGDCTDLDRCLGSGCGIIDQGFILEAIHPRTSFTLSWYPCFHLLSFLAPVPDRIATQVARSLA
jgi:hypothetical protein